MTGFLICVTVSVIAVLWLEIGYRMGYRQGYRVGHRNGWGRGNEGLPADYNQREERVR
jgi:hypothetical protein